MTRPVLLFVTAEAPWPVGTGHAIRIGQLLSGLSDHFEVHFAGLTEGDPRQVKAGLRAQIPALAGAMVERHSIRLRRRPLELGPVLAKSLLSGRPYSVAKFENAAFARTFELALQRLRPSVIMTSLAMMPYVEARAEDAYVVLDSHNVEHQLWADAAVAAGPVRRMVAAREALLLKRFELKSWEASDLIVSICDEDTQIIDKHTATPSLTWPAEVAAPLGPAEDGPAFKYDVGMIGVWSWAPNEDAIAWFARDLAPALAQRGVRMAVAGRALAPGPRRALEALGVEVLGYVESLEKFYASTRVVIAPYRLGGGVRLKVLEALTYGKPVVGTALAFRGISGAGGFPSADDAPRLIAGVIEVLEDFARADHLAKLAQASVMDGHGAASSKAAAEAFIEAFRSSPCRGGS